MRQRLLVVEDNPINLELVQDILEAHGYEVCSAMTGPEGYALARVLCPDLILMDIQLPGRDGISVTRDLKADPATCHIPVVAVTAFAMEGDRERILEAGCAGYLSKPLDSYSLLAEVAHHLGRNPLTPHPCQEVS